MMRRTLMMAAPALLLPVPARSWQKRSATAFLGYYFELTITHSYVSGFDPGVIGFGIADATASVSDTGFWNSAADQPAMGGVFGMSANTQGSVGGINYPNPRYSAPAGSVPDNVYACALNIADKLIWFRNVTGATGWYGTTTSGDPATNFEGWDITGLFTGNIHIFAGTTQRNDTNYGAGVINFGNAAFIGAVPTGYIAWNAADTLNPADKYAGINLSGGDRAFDTNGAGDLASQGRIVRSVGSYPF